MDYLEYRVSISKYKQLIPTNCSFLAIRLCSDRQNSSSYNRINNPKTRVSRAHMYVDMYFCKNTLIFGKYHCNKGVPTVARKRGGKKGETTSVLGWKTNMHIDAPFQRKQKNVTAFKMMSQECDFSLEVSDKKAVSDYYLDPPKLAFTFIWNNFTA